MDTPPWYYRWIYHRPGHNEMKHTIPGFSGIKLVKITEIAIVRTATPEVRARWIDRVKSLASVS